MKNVIVAQVEGAEVPTEILAESIVAISQGVKRLRAGKLNDRALILLIQDACTTRIGKDVIARVLNGMESLEATYIRKPAAKGGR
jgi:hypothetical protein